MRSICRIVCVGVGLFGLLNVSRAQSGAIVRLRASLATLERRPSFTRDTAYIDTLDRLAYAYYGVSSDSAFFYGHAALELAKQDGYVKGEAESWRLLGNTYEMVGDYSHMLSCYHQSLDIAEKAGNNRQVAEATSNIALFDEQQGDYDQARLMMERVMKISLTERDSMLVLEVYIHLSGIAVYHEQYGLAEQYMRQALQTAVAIHDEVQVAGCRNDLGRIMATSGEDSEAIVQYAQSLRYYRQAHDQLGECMTTALLAQSWLKLRNYPLALDYALNSLSGARTLNRKPEIRESAHALAGIYEARGDDRSALRYFKLYKDYSDSLSNDEEHKRILALAASYNFDKKESRLRDEAASRDDRYQQALREDAVKIGVTVLVIVILCFLTTFLLRGRNVNRRMNQLLREKNAKIEEQKETVEQQAVQLLLNNREKDKLFSIVAHDLRGPLNSLKTLMDLLKEKKLSETELNDLMQEFRRNVDHSSELVSNILSWASSQLDGMAAKPVALPLAPTVRDILTLFSHQAAQKGVLLREAVSPSFCVFADKDMVQVILRNLLSNSIKFCRAGDSVTISAVGSDKLIEVCVADTGTGLRGDMLEKIRRKEGFTSYGTAREKGTGLGILLCREFTEANGGQFRMESEWGKGCRCFFSLPAFLPNGQNPLR
jgi:two-component system sensor histidine kinase/response regulator